MTKIQQSWNSIKNILNKEQTEILETALFSMIPVLFTKISGQLYSLVAASYFGTRDVIWQQFLLANIIPEFISNLLIVGLLGSIVLPSLVSAKKHGGRELFMQLYSTLLNLTLIIFTILTVLIILFADKLFPLAIRLFSNSNTDLTPEQLDVTIEMIRILLFPQIILAISVFISSGLNVYNRYIVPQLAPLLYNIGRIFAIIVLVPISNFSPWSLVVGVYLGAFLHLIIQIPVAYSVGLRFNLYLNLRLKYLKEIFLVSIPRSLSLGSEYLAFAINNFIAASISGGIAALGFANSLASVVPSLFAYTFAYASFKSLSEHFEDKNYAKIQSIIIKTMNEMLFLALPFIVTIMVLRVPVTRLTFGLIPNTSLELNETYQIAWILLWFSVGHIFQMGRWFIYKAFYATKDTITVLVLSIFSLFITLVLSLILTNLFSHNNDFSVFETRITLENLFTRGQSSVGVGGIALGMSIAFAIEFIILFYLFNRNKVRINMNLFFNTTVRKFIAAGVMFTVMYLMYKIWDFFGNSIPVSAGQGYIGSTTLNLVLLTIITVGTSFMIYYLVCMLLKVEELKILKKYLNPIFRIGGLRI
jgi:putative peptidoglycan lipid II flippase